ncbi:uncharacterized protein [Apostichopus japonicus]
MLGCKMGLAPSFPIEMEPVYFERAEIYSSTGRRLQPSDHRMAVSQPETPFHVIHEAIYKEMVDTRRTTHKPREQLENVDFDQIVEKYSRFSLGNIAEFRLEFINFDRDNDALLSFDDVCNSLDKLGDDSKEELRRQAYVEVMPQKLEMCDFQTFVALCDALSRKRDEIEEMGITSEMDYDIVDRTQDSIRAEAEIVQRPGSAADRSPVAGRYHCPVVEFIATEMEPQHEICKGKCTAKSSSSNSPSHKGNFVKNNVMASKHSCGNPGPSKHLHGQTGDCRHLTPSSASLSENNRVT